MHLALAGPLLMLLVASGPAAAQGGTQPPADQPTPTDPQEAEPRATPPARQGREERESRRPQPQVRPRAGADSRVSRTGGPVTQSLLLDANLMGGYDDNLAGSGTGAGAGFGGSVNPEAMASGTVGTLDAGLAYRRGNTRHALQLDSRGMAFTYPDYLERPVAGVTGAVALKTTLGRSTTLDGSQSLAYEPFFSAFSPDAGMQGAVPGVDQAIPVTGLFERRSLMSRSAISLTQAFGRNQSLGVGYGYGTRRFNSDVMGDNVSHSLNANHRVAVSNSVRMRTDYQYSNFEMQEFDGSIRPNRTHRIEGGFDADIATSRYSAVTLSLTGGAARLESVSRLDDAPYSTWAPVATASLKVPLSTAWLLDAGYRREFSMLQGLTNDVYANDTASLSLGGLLTRRTVLQVSGTFGAWRTPVLSGVESTFHVYGGGVQLRQMVTGTVGLVASYNYYRHRFAGGVELPEGFPSEYDRNAVRLGITMRFPLIGPRALQVPGQGR